jgi:hypothetical protein
VEILGSIVGSIGVYNLDQGTKSEMTGEIPNMIKGAQVYGLKRIAAGKKVNYLKTI